MAKRILIISFSSLDRDPRVWRQIYALSQKYQVTAAGLSDSKIGGVDWWPVDPRPLTKRERMQRILLLKLGAFELHYRSMRQVRSLLAEWTRRGREKFDLIIANDIDALPVALEIAGNAPVFFDAHEYYPGQSGEVLWRFVFFAYRDWQCRTFMPRAKAVSTVSQGLADEYRRVYGVDSFLVYNAPEYLRLQPSAMEPGRVRLVHHGAAIRERGIDELIDLMRHLESRFTLDLYLVSNTGSMQAYLRELQQRAIRLGDRVRFNSAVPMQQLPSVLNQYDVGIHLIKPVNFNHANCLPNKFFEFVQARLAIAVGPTPDMKRLTEEYAMGVVSPEFTSRGLAAVLNPLRSDQIAAMKRNADQAARQLAYEASRQFFLDRIDALVAGTTDL